MLQRTKKILVLAALILPGVALAQDVALPEPVATPGKEGEPEVALDVDREIDLANVVTSAAKGVTTVQEAPAIITVITADEIKARGYKWINEVMQTVPGWMESQAVGNQFNMPLVRGVGQAELLMHNGVSLFDPWANTSMMGRSHQLENIKRIEVVTGPGGVLWGANSFLGIVNVITKDAEDVNGLEMNAGYGDGPGNRQHFRAYAMFGKSFLKGKLKIFQHVSYENYLGTLFEMPQFIASSPAPQPPGPEFFGGLASPRPARSWLVTIDGKYTFGPFSLYYQVPIGEQHPQLTFANAVVSNDRWDWYDRYAVLEYRDRFLKDRVGLTAKGYYTQFVRDFSIQLFPPSPLLPGTLKDPMDPSRGYRPETGGLQFSFAGQLIQKVGVTVDSDFNLPHNVRLLVGGEFFWESLTRSVAKFPWPRDPANLPIYCPVGPGNSPTTPMVVPNCPRSFINDSERFVGALYLNAQWRPLPKVALDAGVRVQKGFGQWAYDWTPLGSAAIVWNFIPDWHMKANYSTGFRPPVFQNLNAAPGGVQYGANPNLRSELSQSFQYEVNARLLRNVRKVRELELRIDYSYTFLENLIQIRNGSYGNTGNRAIHSVEAYSKLYLQGDHYLQASYTFLYAQSSDQGILKNIPSNWFSVGAVFNLVKNMLDLNGNLFITSAFKDPNRYPSSPSPLPPPFEGQQARTSDLTFDKLTPIAVLQLGARLRVWKEKVSISAQFYNVLNQRYYIPDFFNDVTPSVEMTPTPAPGFNFFGSITFHP